MKNKIHLIGNAHLDPVWLWTWQEGFAEIKATFKSALDRMREYEDFKFTSACGAYYMWIEKSDPEMFREIQERVKEGRWHIAGGWFIQPDCNIPCGESFARHALITQRYFKEKFGKTATVGYNVDSFGHNGNLPQILKNCGLDTYVFMRPGPHEKTLPAHLFMWESADGSRVPTYRIPNLYNVTHHNGGETFDYVETLDEGCDQMLFYGIGNHGGGPTKELLDWMHENLSDRYVYSSPEEYFVAQSLENLPVIKDDLQFHAKGCYSACSEIKKNNRYAENKLISAERISVLAKILKGIEYPRRELKYAWERVLFNQFHDILDGCSIREAYDDARIVHGEAMSVADRVSNFARQQISWNINTVSDGGDDSFVSEERAEEMGMPFVVFNPLDHEVEAAVHLRCFTSEIYESATDSEGNILPIQTVRDSKTDGNKKYAKLVSVKVPALGYTVCRVRKSAAEPMENPFVISGNSIANRKIKIDFDSESGEMIAITLLSSGKSLLSAPSRIDLYDDEKHDTWAHGIEFFKDRVPSDAKGSVKVIEEGPVRATIRSVQTFGDSRIIRDYSIYRDSDYIDVKVMIDFREKFRILKFAYPVSCSDPRAYCKIPFGSIERPTNGSESVSGDWIALAGNDGGITIATDSKHSFDAENNELSLTVLRSAMFADHYGARDEFCQFQEQGEHFFNYRISPFTRFGEAERIAQELQNPPAAIMETFHKGELPTCFSGISVSHSNISVTAIKMSEDGEGIILRLYETDGRDTRATVRLFDREIECDLPHNSIKTYLVTATDTREVDFMEWEK